MSLLRTTATNTVFLLAAQAFNRLSGFLVAALLTRYLGTEGFGVYAFVCAYVGFFILISDMGVDIHIIREASCDLKGSEGRVGNAVALKALLAVVAFVASVAGAYAAGIRDQRLPLIALSAAGMLLAPFTLYGTVFTATLKLHYSAILDAVGRVLMVAFVAAVVLLHGSLIWVFVALGLPGCFVAFLTVLFARRLFRPRFGFSRAMALSILGTSLPIAIGLFFTQILMRIDQVMLEALRGSREVGLYAVGVKCCEALNILPAVATVSLFPLLARTAKTAQEREFSKIYSLGFRYLSLVLFPLVMILFLYPGQILSVLFGESFRAGGQTLRILCWSAPLFAMAQVVTSVAISLDFRRLLLTLALCMALLNVLLNLQLIPRPDALGGANGAALATLAALAACPPILLLHETLRPVARAFLASTGKPTLAVLPAMACVMLLRAPPLLGIPAALSLYGAGVLVLKAVDRTDLDRLRRIFRKKADEAVPEAVSSGGR